MKKIVFFFIAISLFVSLGNAQKIVLPRGVLTFRLLTGTAADSSFIKSSFFDNQYFFAAHFNRLPSPSMLRTMERFGNIFEERLTTNTYLIRSNTKPTPDYCLQYGISGVSAIPTAIKKDARLFYDIPDYATQPNGLTNVLIGTFKELETEKILNILKQSGFEITDSKWMKAGILKGQVLFSNIDKLTLLPFLTSVQLQNPPNKILNNIGRSSSGAAFLNARIDQDGRDLNGSGITVGVGDDADPTLHPDIFDRIINHTPGIPNNHGTHVSGTVAGAGILSPRRMGFAPGARVVSQWFSGVWENAAAYTSAYNMVATNNSYGSIVGDCVYAGTYDLYSRMLDLQAFEFPQLLHAFAAGNDGEITCVPFPKSYNTVLGGYQSAKNILTVGRTDYTQVASNTSSSGPVKDGRIKPEITGLGIINSLNGTGNGYFTDFGTSMSSPNIVGGLTLLYQRYRQLHANANPNGALMKALLLNGSRDVGSPGPDYRHGYGTMMLERSLRMLENRWFTERSLTHGQIQDTVISVPENTRLLKVMLYWHDPAAGVLASNTLVHDLDLELIAPGGQTVLPKILNPLPNMVANVATEGADHTNNHEQVLLENPPPGNYTLRVKGTEVLTTPQQAYTVSFDFVPVELRFTNPINGTVVEAGNITFPVAWEDEGTAPGNNTLSYSLDDGANWTEIISGLKDSTRLYFWQPGSIRSTHARLKISKGSINTISERFAIIPNINFNLGATNDQCYSYFRINWSAITDAEGENIEYVVLLKRGPKMDSIATITGQNFYIIPNLNPDSTYYAAIVARINGVMGSYATAISRRPNTGNCNGTISDGNLQLDSIVAPITGRLLTSSAPGNNAPVIIRMRNLDNVATTSFNLKYNINGGPYTETAFSMPVAARSTFTHSFPGIDLNAAGTYHIMAIITNTGAIDPDPANDTLRSTIQVLPNEALDFSVPFTENFETAENYSIQRPQTGLPGLPRWDYINQDPLARLRTYVVPGIAQSGDNAITLDVSKAPPRITNPFNQLIGTFNLSSYSALTHEVRLGFAFKHHGTVQLPHELNKIWIRGSDNYPWIEIYDLSANQPTSSGTWKEVSSINISDVLKNAGSEFSASTQIRFGQYAQYSMADDNNFAGYTFDDIKILLAENDVELVMINNPAEQICGFANPVPITIKVFNGMSTMLNNIPVRYRINNGAWINEIIPSIAAKDTVEFTFSALATFAGTGKNTIEAETLMPGDNIQGNNKKMAEVITQSIVSAFPYYEDFESGTAGFIADGMNSTWEIGKPASTRINTAANGQNAWKTRLTGDYSNREFSYLYTPCFNISSLTEPMLGFQIAYNFEDCRNFNVVCDAGWMEYSLDGMTWQKLGKFGDGENWYDYEAGQVWMAANKTNWAEAIIPLPVHNGIIRLRYVVKTDDGSTREGLAIDNFHIYNGGALPLHWIWFKSNLNQNNEVLLNWKVFNRKEGESFDIQISREPQNAVAWQSIGNILVKAGDPSVYTFSDNQTFKSGTLYYRIIWNKSNGETSISPVEKVDFGTGNKDFILYPNPASNELMVQVIMPNFKPCTIKILTIEGREVYKEVQIPVSGIISKLINLKNTNLSNGMYLIEISNGETRQVGKWILKK